MKNKLELFNLKFTCPDCPDFSNNKFNIKFEEKPKIKQSNKIKIFDFKIKKSKNKSLF